MKKWIALLLSISMLVSAGTALAAEPSQTAQQIYSIEKLKDEIVIPVTETEGSWSSSNAVKGYDGAGHVWTNSQGSIAKFTISGVSAGNYEVYFWVMPHTNNKADIPLAVLHNGKTHTQTLYQKLASGETVAPGWVSLGVYDFCGTGEESVTFKHSGYGNVRVNAIKLAPTDKALTVTDVPEDPKMEEKTDSVAIGGLTKSVDVDPQGRCYYVGAWAFSASVKGPMTKAPNSLWVAQNPDSNTFVEYYPDITSVGNVRISVYMLYWHENQTNDIKYEVHCNGKVDEFHLNPQDYTESQWVTLGTFPFSGSGEESVKLICTGTGESIANTRASTVAFEVLNNAGSGVDVWTTVYVTPTSDSETLLNSAKMTMASLDKFKDMQGHWANYDVEYMANEGLVSGVAEGQFDPEAQITRAEYITILDRAMGYELITGESFADVAADSWYATYVATAKANGLLNGLPIDDGFKPEQPITREEMALFTYNAIKATKKNDEWLADLPSGWENFADTAEVSDWATEALKYLIQTGIIKGTSDTTVSPAENATRAQGAVILKRFMQMFVWAGPSTDEEWVLTFNEEFNTDKMDWTIWDSQNGDSGHILSSRWADNIEVHDGNVYLMNHHEKHEGSNQEWTSAHVWVRPEVFRQSYGYWEARYKYSAGAGVNNAFWMMTNGKLVSEKTQNFEIDVNEGHYPNKVNTNYHNSHTGKSVAAAEVKTAEYDLSADYHIYALEWSEDQLIYYHDGKVIATKTNHNASVPLFPYLSTAILNWAGDPDEKTDGSAMIVDYVRVWQRVSDAENPEKTIIGEPVELTETVVEEIPKVSISEQKPDVKTYPGEIVILPETNGDGWGASSFKPNYHGGAHQWTNVAGNFVKFDLSNVPKGEYAVYFWRLPHKYNVSQMNFYLHNGEEERLVGSAALKLAEGENADEGWVQIGTITATGEQCIVSTCPGANIRASALKVVPLK
ncbi:MAG: S-layer homology domain-containing protein [Clostridia bacterium]|nr:S-layer homology domain-containing protein [Clostridia bacterium]